MQGGRWSPGNQVCHHSALPRCSRMNCCPTSLWVSAQCAARRRHLDNGVVQLLGLPRRLDHILAALQASGSSILCRSAMNTCQDGHVLCYRACTSTPPLADRNGSGQRTASGS
jgi:hypothetical protein